MPAVSSLSATFISGFVGRENEPWLRDKASGRWIDTGKLYDVAHCPRLESAGSALPPVESLLAATQERLLRQQILSPTSVLQLPYSDSRSVSPASLLPSRSTSPYQSRIVLRNAARPLRMASPLPGGYIASSLPTALPPSAKTNAFTETHVTQLLHSSLDAEAKQDHSEDNQIDAWVDMYRKENYRLPAILDRSHSPLLPNDDAAASDMIRRRADTPRTCQNFLEIGTCAFKARPPLA